MNMWIVDVGIDNEKIRAQLQNDNASMAPLFSLSGQKTWARLVSVYDGDTVTLVVPVLGKLFKFKVRLSGIDTPEIRSKSEECRIKAHQSRTRLIALFGENMGSNWDGVADLKKTGMESYLNKNCVLVYMQCYEFDKYGRLLADLYSSEKSKTSFSEVLMAEGFAYPYHGDTKLTDTEQAQVLGF